jgi:hypothetical protein
MWRDLPAGGAAGGRAELGCYSVADRQTWIRLSAIRGCVRQLFFTVCGVPEQLILGEQGVQIRSRTV